MNTIKCTLKTLTPLTVGCGEKIYPFEYWIEGEFVHICSFEKFLVQVSEDALEKNYAQLIELIRAKRSFLDILKLFGLDNQINNFLLRKVKGGIESNVELETFISHPNGRLYIPGSSIKGAIEAALLSGSVNQSFVDDAYQYKINLPKIGFNGPKNIFVPDIEAESTETEIFRIKRLGMSAGNNPRNISRLGAIECVEGQWNFGIRATLGAVSLIREINDFYLGAIREIRNIPCVKENSQTTDSLISIENSASDSAAIIQLGKYGNYFTKSWGSCIKRHVSGREKENLMELRNTYKFGKIPGGRRTGREYGEIFPKTFPVASSGIPFGWALLKMA